MSFETEHTAVKITELQRLHEENTIFREALENIKKHFEIMSPQGFHKQSTAWNIADKALQRAGGGA